MLSNILKNRRLRMGSFATVLTVIFIAVLIILNMIVSAISERYPIQLDLTTGKIYGLSDETIEYLKTVEKDVNIYLLATEDSFGSPNEYYLQAEMCIRDSSNNVHRRFRCDFTPYSTLPYHASFDASQASVVCLAPLHFRRRVTRPVSYYALF